MTAPDNGGGNGLRIFIRLCSSIGLGIGFTYPRNPMNAVMLFFGFYFFMAWVEEIKK